MKRIIPIILLSASLFANELEVDGGITATGEIQSPTIQALLEQIAQLQEQIALLQAQLNDSQSTENQLETRLFEMPISWSSPGESHDFNIEEITGLQLNNALVSFYSIKDFNVLSNELELSVYRQVDASNSSALIAHAQAFEENGLFNENSNNARGASFIYTSTYNYILKQFNGYNTSGSSTLVLAITAQFPSE